MIKFKNEKLEATILQLSLGVRCNTFSHLSISAGQFPREVAKKELSLVKLCPIINFVLSNKK
jgi:hypothetical protein